MPKNTAFQLLAFDYDETLATDASISPDTASALEEARAAGWRLALVTGRPHDELLKICPYSGLFDFVVSENGAVLHVPGDGTVQELTPRPDMGLRRHLEGQGIEFVRGRIVTITRRPHETVILDYIDCNRLALDVFCNRYAVMVVPRGTNKATGLAAGLGRLGIAAGAVIAVGDDENDRLLLAAAGLRVAVGNAIETVKAEADVVLTQPNGAGVSEFIRRRVITAPETLDGLRRGRP